MFQTFHAPSMHVQQADRMAEILSTWKQDYDQLVQCFDSNSDGKLDVNEWELARNAAAKEAESLVNERFDTEPVNTLLRPPRGKPYIIANKDPRQLTRKYRWQSFGLGVFMLLCFGYAALLLLEIGFFAVGLSFRPVEMRFINAEGWWLN